MTAAPSLSRVDCQYGAPMGRASGPGALQPDAGPVSLGRVRLNAGGYDAGGAYWGHGAPLYRTYDGAGNSTFLRAASREAAKAALRAEYGPTLRFYR